MSYTPSRSRIAKELDAMRQAFSAQDLLEQILLNYMKSTEAEECLLSLANDWDIDIWDIMELEV